MKLRRIVFASGLVTLAVCAWAYAREREFENAGVVASIHWRIGQGVSWAMGLYAEGGGS